MTWTDDFSVDYFTSRYQWASDEHEPIVSGGALGGIVAWIDPVVLDARFGSAVVSAKVQSLLVVESPYLIMLDLGLLTPLSVFDTELILGGFRFDADTLAGTMTVGIHATGASMWETQWPSQPIPAVPFTVALTINADGAIQLEFTDALEVRTYRSGDVLAETYGTPPTPEQIAAVVAAGACPSGRLVNEAAPFGTFRTACELSEWSYTIGYPAVPYPFGGAGALSSGPAPAAILHEDPPSTGMGLMRGVLA